MSLETVVFEDEGLEEDLDEESFETRWEDPSTSDVSDADRPKRERRSACPIGDEGHKIIPNPKKRGPYDDEYVCQYCGKRKFSPKEIELLITDQLLWDDKNREVCRVCLEAAEKAGKKKGIPKDQVIQEMDPPYGNETGHIEWQIQYEKDKVTPLLDDDGQVLYVGFPELICSKGHRWYRGEGPRRDIRGKHPILFETHLINRRKREIYVEQGIPDPAFTMDRWGKRPTTGSYHRAHPLGRKVNTPDQRARGSAYYR
jgi:hypothetical protein